MTTPAPPISVGLPVYNGENYLHEAIAHMLAQTFGDWEMVISDNASTDGTEEICREYARNDPRIRYIRQPENLGAGPNFNVVLDEARGKFFRWHSHDDGIDPTLLEKCIGVLRARPEVVICHSQIQLWDDDGKVIGEPEYKLRTDSASPRERFWDLLFVPNICTDVFGLIRHDVLKQTQKMGTFPVGDRVLLSELAFRGPFYQIPERLFFLREHENRSVKKLPTQQERAAWFDVKRYGGKISFPEWRAFWEYTRAIERAPLSPLDRLYCRAYMLKWLRHYRKRMYGDVAVAAKSWTAQRVAARAS